MSRADRLDLILRVIRDKPGITARDVASEFRVSERSVFRDLDHLRSRGIPIEGSRGRRGGLQVNRRWGVGNVVLSNEESSCLLVTLAIAEQTAMPMFSSEISSARKRIVDAFPRRDHRHLSALRDRIYIGKNASARVRASYREPAAAVMRDLERAFLTECSIACDYIKPGGKRPSLRRLDPHVLLINWPAWYLLARDYVLGEPRMFRLDRIVRIRGILEGFRPRPREIVATLLGAYGVPLKSA